MVVGFRVVGFQGTPRHSMAQYMRGTLTVEGTAQSTCGTRRLCTAGVSLGSRQSAGQGGERERAARKTTRHRNGCRNAGRVVRRAGGTNDGALRSGSRLHHASMHSYMRAGMHSLSYVCTVTRGKSYAALHHAYMHSYMRECMHSVCMHSC